MTATAFQDLPLAERDAEWDPVAAELSVRYWAEVEDRPNERYRDAHVWYDEERPERWSSYELLIADVVAGRLTAVPEVRVKSHLGRYYERMGVLAPWDVAVGRALGVAARTA